MFLYFLAIDFPFFKPSVLNKGYYANFAHFGGEFGEKNDFTATKIRINGYRTNHSQYLEFEKYLPSFLDEKFFNFQINEDGTINLYYDENWTEIPSYLTYTQFDTSNIFVQGNIMEKYIISGLISSQSYSELTVTIKDTDEVIITRIKPEKVLTKTDYLTKLTPSFAILFFMGFGRIYRKRFWKQYNKMNTATLQRHINEAEEKEKKAKPKKSRK